MGVPRVLLSDNGTEFCNEFNDTLNEVLMYDRQAYLPVDADLQIESPEELHTGYFELKDPGLALKEYGLVLEEAKRNILEAQLKQKKIL